MRLPVVAIVGRPNVGKSSLFNWLAGRRISIVDPTAGVTRDRVATVVHAGDRYFELVDTGGMGILDADNLTEDIERQIRHAIDEAAVVLFLVDVRDGLVPLDHTV
ncbi:MAG TPA: GTPase, partial [Fimbriiglobus sp.]|nr:GTPase [Fimbriiglobus sp.]